jgi:hypothetical protein
MTFNLKEYQEARRLYRESWAAPDEALYCLCKRYPNHSTRNAIYAKLSIIGRTYATGIERQLKAEKESALDQLAEFFFENRPAIDSTLGRLANVHEPLALDTLETIVQAHGQLVNLLKGRLRDSHSPRSFVSKYMHFHCSAVPIYDDIAAKQLQHEYRWKSDYAVFTLPNGADEEYYRHTLRFWQMYQEAKRADGGVTVKLLDNYLWLASWREKGDNQI